MKPQYQTDTKAFPHDAYKVDGYRGVAWSVLGWKVAEDAGTEWTGLLVKTGQVVAVMIGDDRYFTFDAEELTPLARKEYCGECGQIGCGWC